MLDRVSIGIKTLLRDEKLFRAVDRIRRNLPGAQMIIADDGDQTEEKDLLYAELIREGHKVLICPFDSGFGYKSNRIVDSLDREFIITGSDDFDFSPASVKMGIEKMLAVLDRNPKLDLVGGRVNNRPYEFFLSIENGVVTEIEPEKELREKFEYYDVDLTVNYTMIRRSVFHNFRSHINIRWDENQKIGQGEHGAFFVDLKRAGFKVGYVPGVNISSQEGADSERYRAFRRRAMSPERSCFVKRGIKRYVCGNGIVDYEEK